MSENWGQAMVVENRPGAGATISADVVAKSPADGYSLLNCNVATHGISPSLYKNLPYDPLKDFAPIGLAAGTPILIVAKKDLPPKDLKEFIAYAKKNSDKLNEAHAGVGALFLVAYLGFRVAFPTGYGGNQTHFSPSAMFAVWKTFGRSALPGTAYADLTGLLNEFSDGYAGHVGDPFAAFKQIRVEWAILAIVVTLLCWSLLGRAARESQRIHLLRAGVVALVMASVPQIPHAATRINISPAPIAGTETVSTTTLPLPRYTAARMVDGTGCAVGGVSRMIPGWLIARPPYPARWESGDRPWFRQTRPGSRQDACTQIGNRGPNSIVPANRMASATPVR